MEACSASWRRKVKSFDILNVLHPHWVLCCSQSHGFWFLFFSPFPHPGGKTHSLPGALAFCMAYAWLGELIPHTQSGLVPWCFFFISSAFVPFMLMLFSLSRVCVYHLVVCLCVVVSPSLGSSPTSSSPFLSHPSSFFSHCPAPLCLRCFRRHP